jgi:hypothetical protein
LSSTAYGGSSQLTDIISQARLTNAAHAAFLTSVIRVVERYENTRFILPVTAVTVWFDLRLLTATPLHSGEGHNIDAEISSALNQLLSDDISRDKADVLPLTVVFVEIPTNPDMKVQPSPMCFDQIQN